jgi:hypothetical protein
MTNGKPPGIDTQRLAGNEKPKGITAFDEYSLNLP